MADSVLLEGYTHNLHELFRINSGAMRFKVKGETVKLWLVSKEEPYTELFQIIIGSQCIIKNMLSNETNSVIIPNIINFESFTEFWVSYFKYKVRFGSTEPYASILELDCLDQPNYLNQVGYIKFNSPSTRFLNIVWLIEAPPVIYTSPKIIRKHIDGGKMHWVSMASTLLPQDAFIGGFENEPTYIARSLHNGSLCPGRYVHSRRSASIPWGYREHLKHDFEILCGFDAEWVKTKGDNIPQNAIVGGYSEVQGEPLYIGRAMHKQHLLTGKVHVLYKTCYLPYNGSEIEVSSYEILVHADGQQHTIYDQQE